MVRPGFSPSGSKAGYWLSANQSTLATSPFSFMPSVVAISQALAITLPYFDVHFTEFFPTFPLRFIPREKIQRFAWISSFQSIDLAVIMVFSGPLYTNLVQAKALLPAKNKAMVISPAMIEKLNL